MDGSVHTVVETVKKLGDTLRDCFENNSVAFLLVGEVILPEVNKEAPPLRFEYNINDYGDVAFILEEFENRKNVLYKMHLTEGGEEIYKRQTVTDEMKVQVNGENNIYEAVWFGVEGDLYNYIVKKIKIPNTNNRFTYRFMNIFEIIDQYRVAPRQSGGDDELDSRAEDMKNIVLDGPKPRKRRHDSDTESNNSYGSIESTTRFYSKKHF
jgi:hypothetical protein